MKCLLEIPGWKLVRRGFWGVVTFFGTLATFSDSFSNVRTKLDAGIVGSFSMFSVGVSVPFFSGASLLPTGFIHVVV